MKVNELMIGDWVKVTDDDTDDSFIGQVKAIDELENINVPEGEDVAYPYSIDCLEPIPLTPEILEKNGLVWDAYHKQLQLVCGSIHIGWGFYPECLSVSDWADDGNNQISSLYCKYVHELQHALRLCGIEKEITL